ncbi:phosphoglucomutase (alpha-D-glucose-1,6-bisphosphate-dependent) [Acidisoma sp. L85]|uniref:phosphoglucomutase (alpha-D-glucose-1,6-bisphosphate-dependent) n=1 Tax=Acidisoma sp. L85 TaxID=1641850 RepID=UPI00131ADEAB|nr:phosphoglucomutase (alpha-D-glucose-1,6-bisphosphate-dependent) [Acidisoma sp. L85]
MSQRVSPFAGKTADPSRLINVPRLITAYFTGRPDPTIPSQRVSFGTSGHRGSAFENSFNEAHILAISQAICHHRVTQRIDGPLFIGIDTHALSEPALASALEVFVANEVNVMFDANSGYTPTPVISHAILTYNRNRKSGLADGIVITPSHNPPEDGGFKYNPPTGGPADTQDTGKIAQLANRSLEDKLEGVKRIPYDRALKSSWVHKHDYVGSYVADLANVVDMEMIRASGVEIGIDPLGGASVHYWQPIIETYGIAATVVNEVIDPTFRFMPVDWDGKIRMDCSSPYAMTGLIAMRDRFDVAFATDTDADRHGIVNRSGGLMEPNQFLATAIAYLFANRPGWSERCCIGKTIVSSSIIDRAAKMLNRNVVEVPVGFKWFVGGLADGLLGFAGEESAGASFLRCDGTAWTTDKDGLILGLLAAEITACTKHDPGIFYQALGQKLGTSFYERTDAPATSEQKALLAAMSPDEFGMTELAGEPIRAKLTTAPGNGSPIGGLKVVAQNGWFAARPSGTEDIYKIYAESFQGEEHLRQIQREAQEALDEVFKGAGLSEA